MKINQKLFLTINLIGGILVLTSYYWGIQSDKGIEAFWGGVPNDLRSVFMFSMLISATSFFIFSIYIFKNIRTELLQSSLGGVLPYLILFGVIQLASALWMPLVGIMISNPTTILWIGIRMVLIAVPLAALVIFFLLLKLSPKQSDFFYYSTLISLTIFLIHTGILDAVIWPYFWKTY